MVKTTYAVTLFAAVSMAAPMAPTSNDYTGVEPMRRDGTGNLIGAGADGSLNQLVGQLYSNVKKQNADLARQKTPKQRTEVAEAAKHQKPNILQSLPLIGGLLGNPKRSVEEKELHDRSLTGDLSHFPILGELFGGNQNKNQNTNKPLNNGDAMPAMSARSYEYPGQNHGQNHGQNAGQNAGQNEGQNWMQNYGQNKGQNEGQNDDQNEGQNWLQNYGQNTRRDLPGELSSLPLIGSLLGGKKGVAKRDSQAKSQSLGLLYFIKKLTSGGSETISHRRREDAGITNALSEGVKGVDVTDLTNPDTPVDNDVDYLDDLKNPEADATADAAFDPPSRRDLFDVLKSPQPLAEEQQAEKAQKAKEGDQGKDEQKPAKDDKKAVESPLKELFSESGLGELVGGAKHGVGILPMKGRRDVPVEARGEPIQGATLPDVLLNGGVLGKVAKFLSPGGLAPAGQ